MIALENQLANFRVFYCHKIVEQITDFISLQKQLVSLRSKATKEEFVHHLMTKLLESFTEFCDTISLLPTTPSLNTFVGMLKIGLQGELALQVLKETSLHVKGKGKCNALLITVHLHRNQPTIQPIKSLLATIVAITATSSPIARKEKGQYHKTSLNNPKITPRSNSNQFRHPILFHFGHV